MEEIITAIGTFIVDKLISALLDKAAQAILKGIKFIYNKAQGVPSPPPFVDYLPSLDAFSNLSAVLRVFLPIDLIARLLFATVTFYAVRIVFSGAKMAYRSGFVKKIFGYITGIFGGFLTGDGSDDDDKGGDSNA